ncbi:DUF3616 domain-containing protein [Microcystis elabens FACHB-917]|nr:DUF3616 domain-containing protein [Microcystis elabens FACHB-917]
MPYPLLLARPAQQRLLQLGQAADKDARALRDNLSGLAGREGWLWLAGDEGRSLLHLRSESERREGEQPYGHPSWLKQRDFGLAGSKHDGESDLEGLALDGERLWLVGSHSLRRFKHTSTDDPPLALESRRSANAQVLGCLHLDARGFPRSGQRLRCNTTNSEDALTAALASEPLLRPFLPIPGKDNGLDIEGITLLSRGNDVLILAVPHHDPGGALPAPPLAPRLPQRRPSGRSTRGDHGAHSRAPALDSRWRPRPRPQQTRRTGHQPSRWRPDRLGGLRQPRSPPPPGHGLLHPPRWLPAARGAGLIWPLPCSCSSSRL